MTNARAPAPAGRLGSSRARAGSARRRAGAEGFVR